MIIPVLVILLTVLPLSAQTPIINEGGIVSAASQDKVVRPAHLPKKPESIANAELFSLYGSEFTDGSVCHAAAVPLPTELCGTRVLANGSPVPLIHVQSNQINGAMPEGASLQFQVSRGNPGVLSNVVNISPVPEALKLLHDGTGRAIATHIDGQPVDFANPIRFGSGLTVAVSGT